MSGPIHFPLTMAPPGTHPMQMHHQHQQQAAYQQQPHPHPHAHAHAAAAAAAAAHQYAQTFAYHPQPPPAAVPMPYPAPAVAAAAGGSAFMQTATFQPYHQAQQAQPHSFDPMNMFAAAAAHGVHPSASYPTAAAVPSLVAASLPSVVGLAYGSTLDPNFDAEAELLFLNKLEKKAFVLQQKGHHLYAIELMEQSVASRKLLYGPLSEEVMAAAEKLALLYNSLAMTSLYKEEYKQALRLLRKAELLTSHISQLTSVRVQTLNNLACAYRRLQRPKTALNLLRESLVLLSAEQTVDGRPVTHLNMCAILSQLHRHEEALDHAKAAVMHCQKQLLQADEGAAARKEVERKDLRRIERRARRYVQGHDEDDDDDSSDAQSESAASDSDLDSSIPSGSSGTGTAAAAGHQQLTEKIVILGIAYHNLGVEEEFLGHWAECLSWYTKAWALARDHIGEGEEITKTFRTSLQEARDQVDAKKRDDERRAKERVERVERHAARSASQSRAGSRPASASSSRYRESAASSVGVAAAAAQRASSAVRSSSRPSSAAPYRDAPRQSSSSSSSSSLAHPPQRYASQASLDRAHHSTTSSSTSRPAYAQETALSSGRVRPKSATVSRPPRPR